MAGRNSTCSENESCSPPDPNDQKQSRRLGQIQNSMALDKHGRNFVPTRRRGAGRVRRLPVAQVTDKPIRFALKTRKRRGRTGAE